MSISDNVRFNLGKGIRLANRPSWLLAMAGTGMFLIVWQYIQIIPVIPEEIFPTPVDVATSFIQLHSMILDNAFVTLQSAVVGFLVALVLALVTGTLIQMSPVLKNAVFPLIISGNSVPRIAVAPLIIFYFDNPEIIKFLIASWMAYFPLLINTIEGLSLEDSSRESMLQLYDATKWQELRYVRIPQGLPHIFDGMKLAVNLAIVGAVVAEFIAAEVGIGAIIIGTLSISSRYDVVLAAVLIMGVISVAILLSIFALQDRIVFWRETTLFGRGT